MANSVSHPQVPQHVTALLSHLTSRPGVQSTLILSRKDGSIIQCTGLLASASSTTANNMNQADSLSSNTNSNGHQRSAAATASAEDIMGESTSNSDNAPPATAPLDPSSSTLPNPIPQTATTEPSTPRSSDAPSPRTLPYRPSHAETLAAYIYAFVSSATALSLSLLHPAEQYAGLSPGSSPASAVQFPDSRTGSDSTGLDGNAGADESGSPGHSRDEDEAGADGHEKLDDEELKLLRLRTKKHEIVVVPDKKYLLCVVHDALAHAAGSAVGNGADRAGGSARIRASR